MSKKDNAGEDKPQRVQGEPAPADTKSWYEHLWKTQQETPGRLEEAAKFLSGVISITLTLFLTLSKDSSGGVRLAGWTRAAAAMWLLSLVLCVLVIFPWRYRFCDISLDDIKRMHKKIVQVKYTMLAAGVLLFLAALTILVLVF
jgi:hypothetical protein